MSHSMQSQRISKNWWNRPYPFLESSQEKWLVVVGFSLFTYVFLLLYRPFGAEQLGPERFWFLLGFAANVFLSLSFSYFFLPRLASASFRPASWVVWKEVGYLSFASY